MYLWCVRIVASFCQPSASRVPSRCAARIQLESKLHKKKNWQEPNGQVDRLATTLKVKIDTSGCQSAGINLSMRQYPHYELLFGLHDVLWIETFSSLYQAEELGRGTREGLESSEGKPAFCWCTAVTAPVTKAGEPSWILIYAATAIARSAKKILQ